MTRSLSLLALALTCVPMIATAATGNYAERPEGKALLERLQKTDGVDIDAARALLEDAEYQPKIVATMRKPAERTLTWADYRPIFLQAERARKGAAYIEEHRALFDGAEVEYGVPANIIAAIIGVETKYGAFIGRDRVLDALATLGFDYPERADYFIKELENFVVLCVEEDLACDREIGSYAGAMGLPQFMPSSYRAYAVDGNDNGKRDLWEEPADIIYSVANYLAEHGWQRDARVALPAWIGDGENLDAIERSSRKPAYRWDALDRLGVRVDDPPPNDAQVGLLQFEGAHGTEYWLGLNNFFVITTYNHSPLYAMAVYQLGQEIAYARQNAAKGGDPAR
ncbi:peptidoglycan lytic transglycosylase [Salinisphaera shabanensis T35B1]|uniref:Membrane-bound lytic transglycosylase protein n=1 Tax=Salinisphaera shabanensis E1L3A TaxID=1033802 RepID=U2FUC4_9GAMM|nr:lytic murein transglycosylase B [Salinisphaera shabanensis]ERJ17968.1 Membrane-bound lytic transglycosylase protein [Salinisphaera shabanensis E1L3A]